jgi:ABC-type sulfate transport system permease component
VYWPRRVLPWAGIFVGAFLTYRSATGEMGSIFLITGPALMALGVITLFVYRWMAKRGL